jgi:hypothetical protein
MGDSSLSTHFGAVGDKPQPDSCDTGVNFTLLGEEGEVLAH